MISGQNILYTKGNEATGLWPSAEAMGLWFSAEATGLWSSAEATGLWSSTAHTSCRAKPINIRTAK